MYDGGGTVMALVDAWLKCAAGPTYIGDEPGRS